VNKALCVLTGLSWKKTPVVKDTAMAPKIKNPCCTGDNSYAAERIIYTTLFAKWQQYKNNKQLN